MYYKDSYAKVEGTEIYMDRLEGDDILVAQGAGALYDALEGEVKDGKKFCPLTRANRFAINKFLPYTAPTALGRKTPTMGLGDRLGICGYAHLGAMAKSSFKPILAQQSLRELNLTNRSYIDIIDIASWSVLMYGWKEGWGADGDHLKFFDDIKMALDHGCTMITLDCSESLRSLEEGADVQALYEQLDAEKRAKYEEEYLDNKEALSLGIRFTKEMLMKTVLIYEGAVELAKKVQKELFAPLDRAIDFEVSLDETVETTSYCAHFFFAKEMEKAGVEITSLAPRFKGEFQKGIDYIGDTEEFAANYSLHAAIAKHFGYKISVHSGSDKFGVFPMIQGPTDGCFHIKTSGTNWLQAVLVLAKKEPALFRDMYDCAMENFDKARAYYVVHSDPSTLADINTLKDEDLPGLFQDDTGRQLIHITYGFMLNDPELSPRIRAALKAHKEEIDESVQSHILRHIESLGM